MLALKVTVKKKQVKPEQEDEDEDQKPKRISLKVSSDSILVIWHTMCFLLMFSSLGFGFDKKKKIQVVVNKKEKVVKGDKMFDLPGQKRNPPEQQGLAERTPLERGVRFMPTSSAPRSAGSEQVTSVGKSTVGVQDFGNRNVTVRAPMEEGRVEATTVVETGTFLKTLDSCLDLCNSVCNSVVKSAMPLGGAIVPLSTQVGALVDKGGTVNPPTFDPSNPDTWPDSIKQADKELSLVMSRMKEPATMKAKPHSKKLDVKVNLVKGNSGALIRSSSRLKR